MNIGQVAVIEVLTRWHSRTLARRKKGARRQERAIVTAVTASHGKILDRSTSTALSRHFVANSSRSGSLGNGGMNVKLRQYVERVKELYGYAVEDGIQPKLDSLIDFIRFVRFRPNDRKGDLILVDNGNLRVEWNDNNGTKMGLQFMGNGMVQYVIFKKRKTASEISRTYGRDSFIGINRQIEAFRLGSLLVT